MKLTSCACVIVLLATKFVSGSFGKIFIMKCLDIFCFKLRKKRSN